MENVFILSEYITLGQFLKFIGAINNGGEAKYAVKTLKIRVNGVSEDRRGRKLYPGDKVEIGKNHYLIESKDEN